MFGEAPATGQLSNRVRGGSFAERRLMVPEEYKASRSAMSFAWCAGFFRRRNGATGLMSPEEMGPSCIKEPWAMSSAA
jgi:hypothetical protein